MNELRHANNGMKIWWYCSDTKILRMCPENPLRRIIPYEQGSQLYIHESTLEGL